MLRLALHFMAGWLLLASLGACARAPKREAPPPPPPTPEDSLRRRVHEAYVALERLELERWQDLLSADLVFFGLGPRDVCTDRDDCIERARQMMVPIGLSGASLVAEKSDVKVGLAPNGKSAWLWDFATFALRADDRVKSRWKVRLTAHAFQSGGEWVFDAVHLSLGLPNEALHRPSVQDELDPPTELDQDLPPAGAELAVLLQRFFKDQRLKIEHVSDGDAVVLVGTDPSEVFTGGKAFKDWARPLLPQLEKAAFSLKTKGGVRARVAPGGETGWVATHVSLTEGTGKKAVTLPPFRGLFVFAHEAEGWRLVVDHQSVGLPEKVRRPHVEKADAGP